MLPHESPESDTIDAYIGKYFHCILYNSKGRKKFVTSSSIYLNLIVTSERCIEWFSTEGVHGKKP